MLATLKRLALGTLLAVCLSGCGTTQDHRIRVYPNDFRTLEEAEKAMIRSGRIARGFTPRMVYMALGTPDLTRTTLGPEGERVTWIYAGRIREEDGSGAAFRTTNDLIWGSPFRRQAYDRLRVVFVANEVIEIETVAREP